MTAAELAVRFDAKQTGDGWRARCPACGGRRKDVLSIRTGDNGHPVIYCHKNCDPDAVLQAVGLTMADLRADLYTTMTTVTTKQMNIAGGRGMSISPGNTATPQPERVRTGCTLAAYAAAKRLPIEQLKTLGLSDFCYMGTPAVRMPYRNVEGQEQAVRFRLALHQDPDGDQPRFVWRRGSKPTLYGLERLAEARAMKYVVLVEGESDSQTLVCRGIPALGLPGAGTYREEWTPHFEGIEKIFIVIEPDSGGDAVLTWLGRAAIRDRVRLIRLATHKDVSDLWVADPDQFMDTWVEAVKAAELWTDYAARQIKARALAEWTQCAALAGHANILQQFDQSLDRRGVVGERRAARLVYLAATSRSLDRPVSLAVKGPSSGGKSYIVDQTLEHFPPEAFYALSAMSERALAYSEEPLQHRMLVIYEAVGMTGDFASYLIRSLLSEGCVRYETVEKTKDGIRPRLIEREGPTGLITTTTAVSLHPENETRLLSIPVNDTPDQTRQILQALSVDRDCASTDDDLIPWRALQTWLATTGRRVVVPYAHRLAEQIPPVAIRLRRDFTTLLTLIQAHALLHQITRDRDATGRIVATIEDYRVVRELVIDLFDVAVQGTVSETVRETVAAVMTLNGVSSPPAPASLGAVAKHLNLDKGTVSRRVKVALGDGYLRNLETKRNQPMQLVCGDALPEAQPVLPDPTSLSPCCSVAVLHGGMNTPPPPFTPSQDEDLDDDSYYSGA